MDLVSLLITLIGIMVLLGLYVMSRLYDQSPVKQSDKNIRIPTYTDASGNQLSSIKADFPAPISSTSPPPLNREKQSATSTPSPSKNQHVLFIASLSGESLEGNKILAAMKSNKLKLGINDIYHFLIEEEKSLFSIANGVAPWTLKDNDLIDQNILGLSLIMQMPTIIDKEEAIHLFVEIGGKLADAIGGELQNTQQQIFLDTDKEIMLAS